MEEIKVFVSNLPDTNPWYIEWTPIYIAIIALITSLVSLYYSRRDFRLASRPYVWAMNFATLNHSHPISSKNKYKPLEFTV